MTRGQLFGGVWAACDPESSKEKLEELWEQYPLSVLENPVTALYLLEDPSWVVPKACLRLLQVSEYYGALDAHTKLRLPRWVGMAPLDYEGDGDSRYGYGEGQGWGHGNSVGGFHGDGGTIETGSYGQQYYGGSGHGTPRKT